MLDDTSRATAPEVALLSAVVLRAIEDLDVQDDEMARFEAFEFFLQPAGPWADMRRFYLDALGIEESLLLRALAPKLIDPPEHPEIRRNGWEDIYRKLPNRPFTVAAAARICNVSATTMSSRLQVLMAKGFVRRPGRGLFIRSDVEYIPPPPIKPIPERILDALADKVLTIREIGFAMQEPVDSTTIRAHLARMVEQGLVQKEVPIHFRRTAPHSPEKPPSFEVVDAPA